MNERIRELAEQAKEYATTRHTVSNIVLSVNSEKFERKFAELIVQEMCNLLDKEQWDISRDWICYDGTRIIPKVKDHFGVEE